MAYQLHLDCAEFIQRYWQKRPTIIKQGFSSFEDPITADELAGLAMEADVDSRLVSIEDTRWKVSHGPFDSYNHLAEQNWSLLVQAVNHWHPGSAALIKPFRFLPEWRMDDLMVSYSVPGGGVGPHLDQYDVFIIQGAGRRRWRVGEKQPMEQHRPHPDLLQVAPFDAIIDEELMPGDILYIPPGFPHEGYSLETSLNYSVGFRAPNARELISHFADYVIANELGSHRYSDPGLASRSLSAQLLPQEMENIRQLMLEQLSDPHHFPRWLGEFISQSRHELDLIAADPLWQPDEVYAALQQGEYLIRLSGLRVLLIDGQVWANGEHINCSDKRLLNALLQHESLNQSSFGDALRDPKVLDELTTLINRGYWYFDDDE